MAIQAVNIHLFRKEKIKCHSDTNQYFWEFKEVNTKICRATRGEKKKYWWVCKDNKISSDNGFERLAYLVLFGKCIL